MIVDVVLKKTKLWSMPHSIKFSIGFVFLASQKSYQPFRVIRLWRKSRFIGFLGYAEFLAFLTLAILCIVKSNPLGLKCSLQFILFASSLNISTISQFVFVLILSSVGVFATPTQLRTVLRNNMFLGVKKLVEF